jgi:hypothetical protein
VPYWSINRVGFSGHLAFLCDGGIVEFLKGRAKGRSSTPTFRIKKAVVAVAAFVSSWAADTLLADAKEAPDADHKSFDSLGIPAQNEITD